MAVSAKESFVNDIGSFILSSEASINSIISDLGWSIDHMWKKDDSYEICPFDSGHWVPKKSLQKHVELCSCIRDGYTKEEIESLPPDPKFCYEGFNNVVTVPFDEEVQDSALKSISSLNGEEQVTKTKRKVPKTMSRSMSDFTREERLSIYDYAVARSKEVAENAGTCIEEMNLNFDRKEDIEKRKSFLEVLAEQRDYKRRRQSYRAKNVHITKKSYTEVMREVIQKQMVYLDPEGKEEEEEEMLETTSESLSVDGRNFKDGDSSREFGRNYDEREDSRTRSSCRSFGRDQWRDRSELNRNEERFRESFRPHNFDETSRDSRSHKRRRSRTPTRRIVSPKQEKDRRNECVSPPTSHHHRDGSSRHKKKHKHRHHKRKSSERHRD